jgi:hypothetical protein
MNIWWDTATSGLVGAIGGGFFGLFGSVVGPVMGICAPKGKAKTFVLGSLMVAGAVGVAFLIAGIVALATGQPYHVWYPLMLIGGFGSVVPGVLLPIARLRYRQAEQRRMDASAIRNG